MVIEVFILKGCFLCYKIVLNKNDLEIYFVLCHPGGQDKKKLITSLTWATMGMNPERQFLNDLTKHIKNPKIWMHLTE